MVTNAPSPAITRKASLFLIKNQVFSGRLSFYWQLNIVFQHDAIDLDGDLALIRRAAATSSTHELSVPGWPRNSDIACLAMLTRYCAAQLKISCLCAGIPKRNTHNRSDTGFLNPFQLRVTRLVFRDEQHQPLDLHGDEGGAVLNFPFRQRRVGGRDQAGQVGAVVALHPVENLAADRVAGGQ